MKKTIWSAFAGLFSLFATNALAAGNGWDLPARGGKIAFSCRLDNGVYITLYRPGTLDILHVDGSTKLQMQQQVIIRPTAWFFVTSDAELFFVERSYRGSYIPRQESEFVFPAVNQFGGYTPVTIKARHDLNKLYVTVGDGPWWYCKDVDEDFGLLDGL